MPRTITGGQMSGQAVQGAQNRMAMSSQKEMQAKHEAAETQRTGMRTASAEKQTAMQIAQQQQTDAIQVAIAQENIRIQQEENEKKRAADTALTTLQGTINENRVRLEDELATARQNHLEEKADELYGKLQVERSMERKLGVWKQTTSNALFAKLIAAMTGEAQNEMKAEQATKEIMSNAERNDAALNQFSSTMESTWADDPAWYLSGTDTNDPLSPLKEKYETFAALTDMNTISWENLQNPEFIKKGLVEGGITQNKLVAILGGLKAMESSIDGALKERTDTEGYTKYKTQEASQWMTGKVLREMGYNTKQMMEMAESVEGYGKKYTPEEAKAYNWDEPDYRDKVKYKIPAGKMQTAAGMEAEKLVSFNAAIDKRIAAIERLGLSTESYSRQVQGALASYRGVSPSQLAKQAGLSGSELEQFKQFAAMNKDTNFLVPPRGLFESSPEEAALWDQTFKGIMDMMGVSKGTSTFQETPSVTSPEVNAVAPQAMGSQEPVQFPSADYPGATKIGEGLELPRVGPVKSGARISKAADKKLNTSTPRGFDKAEMVGRSPQQRDAINKAIEGLQRTDGLTYEEAVKQVRSDLNLPIWE